LPSPLPDEAGVQPRLFEAVARLVQALAERAPLLVVVDDLQWADAASLDMLHYVCRRLTESRAPVLLLIALRAEALAPQLRPEPPGLAAWLSGLQRDVPLTRLILEPLSAEETVSIVEVLAQEASRVADAVDGAHHGARLQRLGRREVDEGVARFGQWLFAETGGQPFFIFETLKALLDQGVLVERLTGDGVWAIDVEAVLRDGMSLRGMVPAGVRGLIRARLGRLSPSAGALVAAAAILAHHSSFDLLCRVAGLDEHEGLAALDVALAAGLLRQASTDSTSEVEPSYVCVHDKVREVVYREVGDARRRSLHRHAFEALQAAHAPAAVLAHHALAAGLLEAAARLSLQAGNAALQLFAVHDAIAHYEQARDLASRPQVALPAMELLHIYLQLGRAYELNTEFERARATYEDLLASAQVAQQPEIEWAALNRLATLAGQGGRDVDLAVRLLQQALGTAERSGNLAGVAETEWNLAQLHFYAWDADAAVTHGERALALARELNLRELVARSLNVLAYAKAAQDRLEEWGARAEESRVLYARLGNRAMEADCLCIFADNQLHLGRPHAAIELARRAQVMTAEIENTWGQVYSALELAVGLLETGAYAEALRIVQQAVAIASAKGITLLHVRCLATLGAVHRALLDLEAARAVHHEALAISESITLWPYTQMIAAELCADYAEAGAWQAACAYALHALPARRFSMWRYAGGFVLYYQTAALVHGGEHKQAQEDVRRFGEHVGKYPRYRIPYLRALAVLAEEQGELRAAIDHLEEAAHLAEAIQIPDEQWRIQALLGDLYQRAGDNCRAREAFSRAASVVRGLADQLDDAQLQAAFYARAQVQHVLDAV
jgi:predicted ATPase